MIFLKRYTQLDGSWHFFEIRHREPKCYQDIKLSSGLLLGAL